MVYRKENHSIDFFKFLFCCIIFLMHYRCYFISIYESNDNFSGGYLGVEFFFLVSGFFMMSTLQHSALIPGSAEKSAFLYLIKRYRRLYPLYIISIILYILTQKLIYSSYSIKLAILKGFPNFLALQIFWRPINISIHFWYVSALLWASFLVYYLLLKNKDLFIYIIEPISLLSFIGITYRLYGHIDLTDANLLWICGFRAFVEIGLGCCIYCIFEEAKTRKSNLSPWIYTVLEVSLLFVILAIMYRTRQDYKDYVMIFLLAAFTFLIFLKRGYLSTLLDNQFSAFLGSISYLMYLNQCTIIESTTTLFPALGFYPSAAIRIFILAAVSWLELFIYNSIKRKMDAFRK